ncbi:hypothetical protein [Nocardia transvalensis]|uniref:hypothetical protein n=1 Tax=Nocardia transvalensis TaxID=37333 RepID=UPI00189521BD|nr:hypothetical protein [Nocardia transvalensis]MBF6330893.1 hypothetical protein [Nocardia transvalensis]
MASFATKRARRAAMLTVGTAVGIAALAGCSAHHDTPHAAADPDTADCLTGARVVGGLQGTFQKLSDQLNGIGPASERGDLADLQNRVTTGADLAARIKSGLDPATAAMSSVATKRAYAGVADAGDRLHTALLRLDEAVHGTAGRRRGGRGAAVAGRAQHLGDDHAAVLLDGVRRVDRHPAAASAREALRRAPRGHTAQPSGRGGAQPSRRHSSRP